MPNTPNILMEQTGATAGEYEYDYGSYGDLLEKQLAAIKAQAELKEKERAETSPLGTRNMAILNLALTGRGVVEGAREKYIMNQMQDMGKEAKFISQEKYDALEGFEQADYKRSTDGRWFEADEGGNWEYEKGPESKLKQIRNALIGWQQGIKEVAAAGQGMDAVISGKAEKVMEDNVVPKIDEFKVGAIDGPNEKGDYYKRLEDGWQILEGEELKSHLGTQRPVAPIVKQEVDNAADEDITGDDLSRAPEVFDENLDSGTEAGIPVDLSVDQSDGAYSSAMADIPKEELGDIKPDKAWENVNVKSVSSKIKEERIASGDLNIYGREMDKNPSADKFMDWNEQAELRRKGTGGGSMTAAEWNELRDGSSEEVTYDNAAVTDEKPKMTTERWGGMGKKEQAGWRSKMKSELGIFKSSNKMAKRSGLMKGLDALKKLKSSIVNRIIPPTAAAFKTDNNSLYKQMRGVGINPLNK